VTKAIGYVRVSTQEQVTNGVSLDAQAEKIRAYASLYDITLLDIIIDAGESAIAVFTKKWTRYNEIDAKE